MSDNQNFLQKKRILGELTSSIIIEYIQPRKVKGKPKIKTEFIRLKYAQNNIERDAQEEQQFGCNPLIKCPLSAYEGFPMSDDLKNLLATSVVKMHIYRPNNDCTLNTDWDCTGTFINNTGKRLLILTANHNLEGCYEPNSPNNPVKLRLTFNFEKTACDESSDDYAETVFPPGSGIATAMDATLLARNYTADMALLEIASLPEGLPALYRASFDNWQTLPSKGFSIHHPLGDFKRFSIQDNNLGNSPYDVASGIVPCDDTSESYLNNIASNENGPYFAVDYEIGAPSGASSGSPYFDTKGSIIGQLDGGNASCYTEEAKDYISLYGRLWYAWDQGYDLDQNGTIDADEILHSTLQPHID